MLEIMANEGRYPRVSFHCTTEGYDLSDTKKDYADKRLSYRLSGESFDLNIFAEWFTPFCFEVSFTKFPHYRYGDGLCDGYTVTIAPRPSCLE